MCAMKLRSHARRRHAEENYIDLTMSTDSDSESHEGDKKPRAVDDPPGQQAMNAFIIVIDDSDDDDEEEESNRAVLAYRERQVESDAKLAAELVEKDQQKNEGRKRKEMEQMKQTVAGRAVLLIESILRLVENEKYSKYGIEALNKDDAVYFAENLIVCKEHFQLQKKPDQVTLGYHYTRTACLENIRKNGLLTVEDRVAQNICNDKKPGEFFGQGIYTGTNPMAFTKYGELGLVVAILKGLEHIKEKRKQQPPSDVNTIIGNKSGIAPYEDEVILRQSCQVIPLIKYPRYQVLAKNAAFQDTLWQLHEEIQRLVDEILNSSKPTVVSRVLPPFSTGHHDIIKFTAFNSLTEEDPEPFRNVPVTTCTDNEECLFCFGSLENCNDVVKLNVCSQFFHGRCLKEWLRKEKTCPHCRISSIEPRGRSPSGTMKVTSYQSLHCQGYEGEGTLCVTYEVPGGIQTAVHPSPGTPYSGIAPWKALFPNIKEGRDLVLRMAYAFSRGLSFGFYQQTYSTATVFPGRYLIGFSSNHGISMRAKLDSWKDANFFRRCNAELDACGVPNALALKDNGYFALVWPLL